MAKRPFTWLVQVPDPRPLNYLEVDQVADPFKSFLLELPERWPETVTLTFASLMGRQSVLSLEKSGLDDLALAWLLHRGYGITAYDAKGNGIGHSTARYANPDAIAELVESLLGLHQPPTNS